MGRSVAIIAAATLVLSLGTAFAGEKDKVKDNNRDGDKVQINKPVKNDVTPGATPAQSVPDGGSSALLLGAALLGLAGAPLLRKKI